MDSGLAALKPAPRNDEGEAPPTYDLSRLQCNAFSVSSAVALLFRDFYHGRETFRRPRCAPRRSGAAHRARPLRRRHLASRRAARLLRAQPACPRQNSRDRHLGGAFHAGRPCRAHRRRPAAAHGDRPDSDAGAQPVDQDAAHPARAGAPRGLLCRPDHRRRGRGEPLSRRGRRRGRRRPFRGLARGERLPRRRQVRRPPRARRPREQRRRGRSHELWRCGRGIRGRGARVRGGAQSPSRRRHDARRPRGARQLRCGRRPVDGMVGDADAAPLPRHARRPARARPRIDPRHRTIRRRRFRHQGARSTPRRRSFPPRR